MANQWIPNTYQPLALSSLASDHTLLIISDMENGFCYEGALASSRVAMLIPKIGELLQQCNTAGIASVAFTDAHPQDAAEFSAFPPHCLLETSECEIVPELQAIGGYRLMKKNCTNGLLAPDLLPYLEATASVDTFLLCGCCTDICLLQLGLALKAYYNQHNRKARVIVAASLCDTYDAPGHDAALFHNCALQIMENAGIEIISEVLYGE